MSRTKAIFLSLLFAGVAFAKPGIVKTNDDRTLEGEVSENSSSVTVTVRGIPTVVARSKVDSVTYFGSIEEQYEDKRGALPKGATAKDHLGLARWLFDNKAYALAAKESAAALDLDVNDPDALALDKTIKGQLRLERPKPGSATGPAAPVVVTITEAPKSAEERFADDLKKAAAGNGHSMGALGECYASGIGTKKDPALAFEWFSKGSKLGDRASMRGMGLCFERGLGVESNLALAFEWYSKAAKAGDGAAMDALGDCYSHGIGVPLDWGRAIDAYEKAANAGDTRAMVLAGYCYQVGFGELTVSPISAMRVMISPGATRRDQKALFYYNRAADAGNPAGMLALAGYYDDRPRPDHVHAAALFKRAAGIYQKLATEGDPAGMQRFGLCCEFGWGVAKDLPKAVDWYRKAADAGNSDGTVSLGICYQDGVGIAKDPTKALQLFEKAAEAGDAVAMRCAGLCYMEGIGTSRNVAKALKWFHLGEKAYDGASVREIGACYENGIGVRKNISTALECYMKGAMFGDSVAMYELGRCCGCGVGTAVDFQAARSWDGLSANAGYAPAKKILSELDSAVITQRFSLYFAGSNDGGKPRYDPDEAERQQQFRMGMMMHRQKFGY